MNRSMDWKGNLGLLIGIIGIVASIVGPIWLWRMDLQAKSIVVRVLSVAPLQPAGLMPDNIQMMLDGHEVKSAVLITVQLMNSGAKPIPASDFESPIQLHVGKDAEIIRAQVTESAAEKLPVILTKDANVVSVQPLLLNPGDSAKILLITANGQPALSANGRIAGVSKIDLEFVDPKRITTSVQIAYAVLSILGIVTYIGSASSLVRGRWSHSTALRIFCTLAGASLFSLATRPLQKAYGLLWAPPTWLVICAGVGGGIACFFIWKATVAQRRLQNARERGHVIS